MLPVDCDVNVFRPVDCGRDVVGDIVGDTVS